MADRLIGIRAKIERANQHIHDLEARISAFRNANPYGVVCENDPKSGERVYKASVYAAIPADLVLVIGDALHNMRSALDYLAWQLVGSAGVPPDRATCFPVYQSVPKDKAHFMAKVKGMNPAAIRLIEAAQPYNSGDNTLWHLSELDNMDKHRLPLKAVSIRRPAVLFDVTALLTTGSIMLPDFQLSGGVDIQDGAELGRVAPSDKNVNFQLAFEIAFDKPTIVEGQPVLPLLNEISEFVDGLVNQFERFL